MAFGRLDRGASSAPLSDINVTPLVDVMLVLVVVFLLTAPLLASSIRLDLPQAASAAPVSKPASLAVVMDKSGQVFLDDKPVAVEAVAARFADAARADPATELQLRADAGVPYGRVVEVLGLAQKAGLTRIGFMADPAVAAPAGRKP
ncbi:biopolymer transporter ExbD [Xylophilus sp. GW821-FHT01B05]|jgi:biopolymer transport protein TolR